jgi:hypothetical protein
MFNALYHNLVLPVANTMRNIYQKKKYTLTIDAMNKQVPTKNKVCAALDGWISTNTLAILSMIGYYTDYN